MLDKEVPGIVAPVKLDISDAMSKFDAVNEKTNVVSRNMVNRLDEITQAQQRLNAAAKQNNAGSNFADTLSREINNVASAQQNLNAALSQSAAASNRARVAQSSLIDSLVTLKKHMSSIASYAAAGAILAAPLMSIHSIAEIEQQMAGMLQTLPSLYKENSDHIVNQQALNEVTKEFIKISEQYGYSVDKVIEAGKLWSRGYKDVGDVMKLTANSTKLAIADMMDVGLANRAVESTISGFQRQKDAVAFSNHVVDSWTNIAHNAQASAQDLAEALIRSAAAANTVGISFDTTSALAATMIKNTGQSGAIVGNALKSIFASINTKKGREGLADLGVELYKLDADGSKHLRSMESVIIDVMLSVGATSKDIQKDLEGIAGGKFQWGRAAAVLGDYQEFIKNYNLSINSSGVADKQVAAQLDTINRKVEQIKASMQGAVMGTAEAGLAQYIKEWLDSINMFFKGLQQIPAGAYQTIGALTKLGVSFYALKTLIGLFTSGWAGATAAVAVNTAATASNAAVQAAESAAVNNATKAVVADTVAKEVNTVATTAWGRAAAFATGGFNLIAGLIVTAGIGAAMYATSVGEAVSATEKEKQSIADGIAVKETQLAMNKKQVEFIGTLGAAYEKLKATSEDTTLSDEKRQKVVEDMQATEKELGKIIGAEAAKRVLASDDIKGAITEEQRVHGEKTQNIKEAMNGLIEKQKELSDKTIQECNDRIGAITEEAEAFDKAADAIGESLGRIAKFMFTYYRNKEQTMKMHADSLRQQQAEAQNLNQSGKFGMFLNQAALEDAGISTNVEELDAQSAAAGKSAEDIVNKALAANVEKAKTELSKQYTPGQGGGGRTGGDEVTDKDKNKNKSTGSNLDPTKNIDAIEQRNKNDSAKHDLFLQAKESADRYSTALDDVTVKETLFGVTAETTAERVKIKSDRVAELDREQKSYLALMDNFHIQAEKERSAQASLEAQWNENGVTFDKMSTAQKQALRENSAEWKMHETTIKNLSKSWDELAERASTAGKKSKQTANEVKVDIAIKNPLAEYEKQMRKNNLDKDIGVASLGNHYRKEQADAIELAAATKNLALAKEELNRIENQFQKDSPEYRQQLLVVQQLTNQIDTLKDKSLIIRQNMASMFDGMMRKTTTFKDFWKNSWYDMMTDALNALWNVNKAGSQSSFLTQLLGINFGGSSNNTASVSRTATTGGGGTVNVGVREFGGPVKKGQPYIVGEKRAELFVPDSNGTIIPDLSMVNAGGSNNASSAGNNIYNVTVNQNFAGNQDASVVAKIKDSIPYIKAEIRNSMATESSMRAAVKGAVK